MAEELKHLIEQIQKEGVEKANEQAETIMSMRLIGGEKSLAFRSGAQMKETFARLKRAQAEAEIRCF